jgi:1-acyl-sn-glycerol-3-phosphate acyltransferase
MSRLRSALFTAPLIVLSTIVMGTLSLLVSLFDGSGNTQHKVARLWARSLLAFSFIRVRVEGLEKLDPGASYVFVSNHQSLMDIPAILSRLPYQFRFFAKKGLFKIPFLGAHLKRAGHLPVDRSNARNSLKSMSEGGRMIAERGVSLLLFPEGGRAPKGLREFKEGAAYIAIKSGAAVVPMAICGMRELLPMDSLHIRSGCVRLRIGAPISTAGMKLSEREAFTQRLYDEVAALWGGEKNSYQPPVDADGRR